jgi:hypothetical protein
MTYATTRSPATNRPAISVPGFCFLVASLTVVLGMSLGIYMGITQNHLLAPVHVHMNVIGWLGLFMIGLYYRAHPATRGTLVRLQAGSMAAGHILMAGGLAALLLGEMSAFPIAVAGSVLLLSSMIVFLVIAVRTALIEG